MVSDIYKVSEVAEMLGFSAKTIRRDIASMPDDVRKMSLACPSDVPVMSLTEQAKNYQVLLQAQQVLSLPAPKRSFFKRLFGIHEEKE